MLIAEFRVKKVLDNAERQVVSVSKAEKDLVALEEKIREVRNHLTELEQQAVKISHFLEMANVYGPHENSPGNNSGDSFSETRLKTKLAGNPPKNVRAAIAILKERGTPIKTKELVEELSRRGIQIGGKIPVTNLSGALSRFKELLVANRSEGWSLTEWHTMAPTQTAERGDSND